MYMDSEKFENWMERIMERFDRTEKLLERVLKKSKFFAEIGRAHV